MLAKLRILHGRLQDKQGQNKRPEVKIRGPRFVIGSASDCSMCCRCGTVSDYHCEVRVEQHRVLVRTLSGEKGTFVNGALVERERILEAGDHLRIGRLEFEVLIDEPAPVCSPGKDPRDEAASDGVDEQFSDLLAEADERERLRRRGNPELRLLHLESAAAETANPQALAVDAARSNEPGKGTPRAKAEPGKLPVTLTRQIVAKDSTDAAQQALRKLFSR